MIEFVVLISLALNLVAMSKAKEADLLSIMEPPVTAYNYMLLSVLILIPLYLLSPLLLISSLLLVGIFSFIMMFMIIYFRQPLVGIYDYMLVSIEAISLFPIVIHNYVIPPVLIHSILSLLVVAYKMHVKKEDLIRFFVVHEATFYPTMVIALVGYLLMFS